MKLRMMMRKMKVLTMLRRMNLVMKMRIIRDET
jgi:hypothetical protein